MWIDTHCHLDAPEFEPDRDDVVQRAQVAGVLQQLLPAVAPDNFDTVRALAHRHDGVYALGIHPLYVGPLGEEALHTLAAVLEAHRDDPRLVAVGEIGLDHFVPGLDRDKQQRHYLAQLKLARDAGLPVVLHVRRSADALLAGLRRIGSLGGIAHAFNGSRQQAEAFIALGFKLGFGGAMTHERALNLRRLAAELPLDAIVLETDAPDIPPAWLYKTAAERAAGATSRNEPGELPRIAAVLAGLRGITVDELARSARANALAALPRWAALAERVWSAAPGSSRAITGPRLLGLPPVIARHTRLVVLGSFPGAASLAAGRYYAHPRNQFWPLLAALWGIDLITMKYDARWAELRRRGLGLWDVYASCEREGSLDTSIRAATLNDLASLKRRAPGLQAVAHNGGESARHAAHTASLGLVVHRLPSTSPANASWSFDRKLAAWRAVFEQHGLIGHAA